MNLNQTNVQEWESNPRTYWKFKLKPFKCWRMGIEPKELFKWESNPWTCEKCKMKFIQMFENGSRTHKHVENENRMTLKWLKNVKLNQTIVWKWESKLCTCWKWKSKTLNWLKMVSEIRPMVGNGNRTYENVYDNQILLY